MSGERKILIDEPKVLARAIVLSGVPDSPKQSPHFRIPEAWLALPAGDRRRFMEAARREIEGRPSEEQEWETKVEEAGKKSEIHFSPPLPPDSDGAA